MRRFRFVDATASAHYQGAMRARHVIATGHPEVTQACAEILEEGGNAFDAVVAGGFVSSLAEPALASLAGGGFVLAKAHDQAPRLFDFFVDAPGRGAVASTPDFAQVEIRFPSTVQAFHIGRGSVAVPGVLKGLLHTHQALGVLPRARVLEPAIRAARAGVVVNGWQAKLLSLLRPILTFTKESEALYAPTGALLAAGERMECRATADLLDEVVKDGARAFYEGEVAENIARQMRDNGGLLTAEDLALYEVIERTPLSVPYRGRTVFTNPGPSLGGSLIALSLALLEGDATRSLGAFAFRSKDHTVALYRAMREVDALRAAKISRATLDAEGKAAAQTRIFGRGTTHMTVADAAGNVASMTTSNGEGSGVLAPGTEIMLNNMLGEDDLFPDGFHVPPPGTRIGSMMAQTLVCESSGDPSLVLGSGGSKRIRTAITQVLTHVVDFGTPLAAAIDSPRMHWDGHAIQLEPGMASDVVTALEALAPVNLWAHQDVYFGGVHAVIVGEDAAGDARRGGDARVIDVDTAT